MRKEIKILYLICFLAPLLLEGQEAEIKYVNGKDFVLQGQANIVNSERYYRLDSIETIRLPKTIQKLSRSTAGFNLNFGTNSNSIHVKWELDKYRSLWNMTPLAVNGFDLYGWNGNDWQYVASAKPTDSFNSVEIIKNLDGKMHNYKLYFPLYTGVKEVQIGIDKDAKILHSGLFPTSKKAVIYGSSITQGASASRPGMAFPSIIGRNMNMEFINLGFSGAGKMELELASILGKMDADIFILDCVPNPSVKEIKERTIPFVEELRKARLNTPILMVESVFRENAFWDNKLKKKVTKQNNAYRTAFETLIEQGYKNLYYIWSNELIGDDHEATIDGTHLTDLGQKRIAERIGQSINDILDSKEKGAP